MAISGSCHPLEPNSRTPKITGREAYEDNGGDDNDVFFVFLLEGNWMMVGIHLIPAGTRLQFLLTDLSDDDVKIAVEKAKAEN